MHKNDCIFFITLIIRQEIERGKEKERERERESKRDAYVMNF